MDSRVDLTDNRDFRRPRPTSRLRDTITTMMITSTNWNAFGHHSLYTTSSSGLGSSLLVSPMKGHCDRCGKIIDRIPWYKNKYYGLCKDCVESMDGHSERLPWKRGTEQRIVLGASNRMPWRE